MTRKQEINAIYDRLCWGNDILDASKPRQKQRLSEIFGKSRLSS